MERTKLPKLKPSRPQIKQKPTENRDDISVPSSSSSRAPLLRRSQSFNGFAVRTKTNTKVAATGISKPVVPHQKIGTVPKTGVKRTNATKSVPAPPPKVPRIAKIPPYDYKARYNAEVEKNSALREKLKNQSEELLQFKTECDKLSLELETIRNNYTECSNVRNELQVENATLKLKNSQSLSTILDLNNQLADAVRTCNTQEELINNYKNTISNLEEDRRIMHNQIQDFKGSIRVFCRVRPQLPFEIGTSVCSINYINEDTIEIGRMKDYVNSITGKAMDSTSQFIFDKVFQSEASQLEVFEELSQLIQSAMDGYNVCVFAYGQTGSGKTYTMQGENHGEQMGMMPRSVNLIFEMIKKYHSIGWVYTVEASFLEIYNETVKDLLDIKNSKENLEIRYNEGRGTTVTNLTVTPVESPKKLLHLMQCANNNRAVAVTNLNEHSSRSHAVTKIILTGINAEMKIKYNSSVCLVDLAGSESAKTSERLTETKNINKSLSTLGTVIMALQNKENHVPYRNSKLTYLLQSNLGGNSKTLMFVNISPLNESYGESINALRFASKVKEVKITSKKNKVYLKVE